MTKINNVKVPVADYEILIALERQAFGLTPSTWPDSMAHGIALEAARAGLAAMREVIKQKYASRVKS